MSCEQDKQNCIKNLIQVICCDNKLEKTEKVYLAKAAKRMDFEVEDWQKLFKEVHSDNVDFYPIRDKNRAVATLKAMMVMAKIDENVAKEEKTLIHLYAKSIGIKNDEFKKIISDIDTDTLFDVFVRKTGEIIVIKDEFEKIDALCKVASDNNVETTVVDLKTLLNSYKKDSGILVCFHASEKRERSIEVCKALLEKTGDNLICIFTRFQGMQVQYLRELGLKKCIIEPVYSQDIVKIFK